MQKQSNEIRKKGRGGERERGRERERETGGEREGKKMRFFFYLKVSKCHEFQSSPQINQTLIVHSLSKFVNFASRT